MNNLSSAKCVPCEGGVDPMKPNEIQEYLKELKLPWTVIDNKKIEHEFVFKNFLESMEFVNKIAKIAEEEQHHPDIYIFYNRVKLTLWTHAIKGLFKNDFIIASKIEELV